MTKYILSSKREKRVSEKGSLFKITVSALSILFPEQRESDLSLA